MEDPVGLCIDYYLSCWDKHCKNMSGCRAAGIFMEARAFDQDFHGRNIAPLNGIISGNVVGAKQLLCLVWDTHIDLPRL